MDRPSSSPRGFSLLEMLVAIAVFAIFLIGILGFLDTSSKVSKVEAALADTQENVRYAAYHILRTARMMGGGGMPFVQGGAWAAGELTSGSTGTAVTPFGTVTGIRPGTDVLTLRGFFEQPPFFARRTDVTIDTAGDTAVVLIRAVDNPEALAPLAADADVAGYIGRGLVFMGRAQYAAGVVTAATVSGTGVDRILTLSSDASVSTWNDLNLGPGSYPPQFQVARVGLLEMYTYYVRDDFTLVRRRAGPGAATAEPVAVNIGGLEVALGVDTTNDRVPDTWVNAPASAAALAAVGVPVAIRLTVLGRTPFPVPEWTEPVATFQVEDADPTDFDRTAKWRRMQVTTTLRNFIL